MNQKAVGFSTWNTLSGGAARSHSKKKYL